jgi:hypothetical protein
MPTLGVLDFFREFRIPYSRVVHARILAEQLVGPIYTLLVVLPCAAMSLVGRKHIPGGSWLLGLAGPVYTVFAAGGISHDFSHTLFQECSGIYGEWIRGICLAGGLAMAVLAGMAFHARRMQEAGAAPVGKMLRAAPSYQFTPNWKGGRFLRHWVPAGVVPLGLLALATGCYTEFHTPMVGKPMILYGAAFISIGLATFGLPATDDAVTSDKLPRRTTLRLRGGLALGAALLIAANLI